MEANLFKIMHMRIKRTIDALAKNNMKAVYVPTAADARSLLETMLVEGETIGVGGSVTLNQINALELLRSGKYNFLDRYATGLSKDDVFEIQRKALLSDTFITSSNAITEHGELYNVDANSNRVSAMLFGPKRVIVIAGQNKIVPDLEHAVVRVKTTAAPANSIRLDCDTFCAKNGHCLRPVCDDSSLMAIPAGACPNTICCNSVVMGRQRREGRVFVIIVGEDLGY